MTTYFLKENKPEIKRSKSAGRERSGRGLARQTSQLYNLILDMTTHHFCHIYVHLKQVKGPAHNKGGITQRHEYQGGVDS